MGTEKLDTEIRREQIAEAALDLVASRGLGRLSIAAVARRVGLVPSGIYRHFKSKEEMLMAVLDLIESRMLANVQAACEETADPLDRLRSLLTRHIRFIREGRTVPRIVFSDDFHHGHPHRRLKVQRILDAYLGKIQELVRQGQQEGRIRRELEPSAVAMMFLGMILPAAILWHVSEGGFDVTRHADRAWQIFRNGVATEESR